jgi:hypothetical protein
MSKGKSWKTMRRKQRKARKHRDGAARVLGRNRVVIGISGPPCHRCKLPTEVRAHRAITDKELQRPFYCSRWFICRNKRCKTTVITPPEFWVWNKQERGGTK